MPGTLFIPKVGDSRSHLPISQYGTDGFWLKEGNFHVRKVFVAEGFKGYSLESYICLISKHPEGVINEIDICGYKTGKIRLYIHPRNLMTFVIIKKYFQQLRPKSQLKIAIKGIKIIIATLKEADITEAFKLIHPLAPFTLSLFESLFKDMNWFLKGGIPGEKKRTELENAFKTSAEWKRTRTEKLINTIKFTSSPYWSKEGNFREYEVYRNGVLHASTLCSFPPCIKYISICDKGIDKITITVHLTKNHNGLQDYFYIAKQSCHAEISAYAIFDPDQSITFIIRTPADLARCLALINRVAPLDSDVQKHVCEDIAWFFNSDSAEVYRYTELMSAFADSVFLRWEDEIKLDSAVVEMDTDKLKDLLVAGVNPNIIATLVPILNRSVNLYLNAKIREEKNVRLSIIENLMFYGADDTGVSMFNNSTALSTATSARSAPLVSTLLRHSKSLTLEFRLCEKDEYDFSTWLVLKKHHDRMRYYQKELAQPTIPTRISIASSDSILAKTIFYQGAFELSVETYHILNMPDELRIEVLKLVHAKFPRKEGSEMIDFNFYVDVIVDRGKVVGFNTFKILKNQELNLQVVYIMLAYIDKPYRGMRIMSLLSFRSTYAAMLAYPDRKTYAFYNAISPDSQRQVKDLSSYFPKYRNTELSVTLVKKILSMIYGDKVASELNEDHLYIPSDMSVTSPRLSLWSANPGEVGFFAKSTKRKTNVGLPIVFPINDITLEELGSWIDDKLNAIGLFKQHVYQFAKHFFAKEPTAEAIVVIRSDREMPKIQSKL